VKEVGSLKVLAVFDTRYGNVHRLADAVAEGAREVEGAEAVLRRVEIVEPEAVIQQNERWREANEMFRAVPQVTVEEMIEADAIAFGTPTRFGSMAVDGGQVLRQGRGGLLQHGDAARRDRDDLDLNVHPHVPPRDDRGDARIRGPVVV